MRKLNWYRQQVLLLFLTVRFLLIWLAVCLYPGISSADDPWSITEVAPGIYLHQGVHEQMTVLNHGDIANSGFIIGSTAVAVIDPGGSVRNARLLLDAITTRTSLPVRYIVLTHIHPDHMAGVSLFPASSIVIAHAHYPRALAQRGDFYFDRFPELFGDDRKRGLRIPDKLVDSELQIDLGDRPLLVTAYPTAHTDNDLSVLDINSRTLFAGDLLFAQRTPSLDGSLTGWLQVLQQMQEAEYELVVPGHGNPGTWTSIVKPQIHYLNALKFGVSQQIERGSTLSQTVENALNDDNIEGWQLFDEVHPVNITKAYTELEWE